MRCFRAPAGLIGLIAFLLVSGNGIAQDTFQVKVTKTWTVEDASQAAFDNTPYTINTDGYAGTDPNYELHREALQQGGYADGTGEVVESRGDGRYAVRGGDSDEAMIYNGQGRLVELEVTPQRTFPLKTYRYSYPDGNLSGITLQTSAEERFEFESSGDLVRKCLNGACTSTY